MNRQDAKLLGFSKEARKTEYSGNYIHLDNVIDIVFDDFESMTCGNCKHGTEHNEPYFVYCEELDDNVNKKWGCKSFEPKET